MLKMYCGPKGICQREVCHVYHRSIAAAIAGMEKIRAVPIRVFWAQSNSKLFLFEYLPIQSSNSILL